ncbi:MAG TPA: nucleoside triphosphate pyrophosphatase [Rhizomicrobium sp.]|jgi:septum formation protein
MKPFVLASASPTRAKLLTAAGLCFEVLPADVDETALKQDCAMEDVAFIASRLAAAKASAVAERRPGAIVLGADQILSFEGEIVSKCHSEEEAFSLLQRLRGRTHELITAATLCVDEGCVWKHVETCRLTMGNFSDAFLRDYLSRAGPALLQNVGCYALEGLGAQLFDSVEGDFFSVLGLPLLPLLAALRDYDVIAR